MNDSDLKYIQRVLESNAPDEDRERAAQMVRDIRRSYEQAPAASAEPVAYRVLRKAHDGEWKDDGRDWCNGKPSADLLADIAKRADSWSIECAYAAPVAAQASAVVNQQLTTEQAPAANGDAPTARELDMAMLIKRLAATLRVAWPESTYMKAADDAMDSLNRWGLAGSPLREGGE